MTDPSTSTRTVFKQPADAPAQDPVVVAIDGPAGSGKSSVAKQAARELGYGYLDTGAAYRALAWHALQHGADTSDSTAVLEVTGDFDYAISLDPDAFWVRVGATDVTDAIREPRVTDAVSGVARVAPVREFLNALFLWLVEHSGRRGVIIEGRDITTVVAPDAPVRILLTAAPEVRAARRSAELTSHDAASVAEALHRRDASDSKVVDFLTAAPGVTVVDSTELDFDATVAAVLEVVGATLRQAQGSAAAQGPDSQGPDAEEGAR
ncbi:(d)CMP kinase [Microbacterium sp. NPDC019599]|uniref:(d)CMP kinase n=1 Tax=Microbacterium sp. NPDC019599 TaxID=3154690 RepID=UPI0033F5D02D